MSISVGVRVSISVEVGVYVSVGVGVSVGIGVFVGCTGLPPEDVEVPFGVTLTADGVSVGEIRVSVGNMVTPGSRNVFVAEGLRVQEGVELPAVVTGIVGVGVKK